MPYPRWCNRNFIKAILIKIEYYQFDIFFLPLFIPEDISTRLSPAIFTVSFALLYFEISPASPKNPAVVTTPTPGMLSRYFEHSILSR